MIFEEHAAKVSILAPAGVVIPRGIVCATAGEAAAAAAAIGPCVVKAQVPGGKRGKAGGIRAADTPEHAAAAARDVIGMTIGGSRVERVLVEERCLIERELYAAVLIDGARRSPILLFSSQGGIDVEETVRDAPDTLRRLIVDVRHGVESAQALALLDGIELGDSTAAVADVLARLYRIFSTTDAELVEVNPLAILRDGRVAALDCKFVMDEAASSRQPALSRAARPPEMTSLEQRGAVEGLRYIQLDGNIGVLANGAGLTMATMDVIEHFGGRPANFLEIGGEAYVKAELALGLVLSNPGVKSLVVNLCGAFARTDVMAAGLVQAWQSLAPKVPAFFSIHGTGEDAAVALIREHLGLEPFDLMEDAVGAAIGAAR